MRIKWLFSGVSGEMEPSWSWVLVCVYYSCGMCVWKWEWTLGLADSCVWSPCSRAGKGSVSRRSIVSSAGWGVSTCSLRWAQTCSSPLQHSSFLTPSDTPLPELLWALASCLWQLLRLSVSQTQTQNVTKTQTLSLCVRLRGEFNVSCFLHVNLSNVQPDHLLIIC